MDIDIFKYNKQASKERLIEYLNEQTEQDVSDWWREVDLTDWHGQWISWKKWLQGN